LEITVTFLTHRTENRADVGWQESDFNVQDLRFSPRFCYTLWNVTPCRVYLSQTYICQGIPAN